MERFKTVSVLWLAALIVATGLNEIVWAGNQAPQAILSILPTTAKFRNTHWTVNGTQASGNLFADFKGYEPTCDVTVGSSIQVDIRGDSSGQAFMIQLMNEQQSSAAEDAKKDMAKKGAGLEASGKGYATKAGGVVDEIVSGGRLVYMEYKENCPKHPNHANTVMQGFARNDKLFMHFFLYTTVGAAETKALAQDILRRFQALDVASVMK